MSLDSIVKVNIDRNTKLPTQKGFGIPAVLSADAAAFASLVTTFEADTALEELLGLGLTTASELYKCFAKILSQSPKVEKLKAIKQTALVAQVMHVSIPAAVNDVDFVVTIDNVPYTYHSDIDATIAEIRDGLIALINPLADFNSVSVDADTLSITAVNSGKGFSVSVSNNLTVIESVANNGPVEDLIKASDVDDDWYFLMTTTHTKLQSTLIADYIETVIKIFAYQTNEADSKNLAANVDTTSIMHLIRSKNYDRTFGVWVSDLSEYKHAAWIGLMAPKEPGSATWKFKEPKAVSADKFTANEKKNIQDKKGNVLNTVAGINMFEEGVVSSGEFIDIMIGTDWIQARIQEQVFALFVAEDKVPYDDGGIQAVGLQVEDVLTQAVNRLILVGGEQKPVVTLPKRTETTAADRAARFLRNVKFSGFYAGAIHKVQIDGTLSV